MLGELGNLGLLAEVEPVADPSPDYQFTLGIRRSFRLSYCYEWCPEMLKASALHVLGLLSALAEFELTLQSPQPCYVLFDGPQTAYINPGSITHLLSDTFRGAVDKFSEFFLYPLALIRRRRPDLARRLLRAPAHGIRADDFPETKRAAKTVAAWLATLSPADCLRALKHEVEGVRIADAENMWSNYYSVETPLTPGEHWSRKQREVYRILSELQPQSVLDLACNVGWYSMLASTVGSNVIAVDFDETCVNRLYRRVRDGQARVLPLIMDINDPTPGLGVGNSWFPPAVERLQSDLVLALAISHHLVFTGMRLTFDEVVRAFAPFAKRWLLVEFVPFDSPGMVFSQHDRPECASWYNLDSFVTAFQAQFSKVTVLPGEPHSRRLVLCER